MKARSYCFTLNNYTEPEVEQVRTLCKSAQYAIFGYEKGEKETPHLQGYMLFKGPRVFDAIKKKMPRAHIEMAKGDAKSNHEYCKKQGQFEEFGEMPKQGQRLDLKAITDDILGHKVTVDEITIERPNLYHQYGRTFNKIQEIANRKKFRNWMTEGIWYYGETGAGKSHLAYEGYNPETHYILNLNDNGFWNGYTGQPIVIINEFRGQIPYGELLDLVDKWPKTVKIKCEAPQPLLAKKIIITSPLAPENIFVNRFTQDKLAQLTRRFKIYHVHQHNATLRNEIIEEVVEGNTRASTNNTF